MISIIAVIVCLFVAVLIMGEDRPLTVAACLFLALLNLPFALVYIAS